MIIVSYLFMNTVNTANTGDSSVLGDVMDIVIVASFAVVSATLLL